MVGSMNMTIERTPDAKIIADIDAPIADERRGSFSVSDLHLHYAHFHALKGININVKSNAITALIGPSGCGKSTFLRCLNRMNDLVPGAKIVGSIKLDGQDIYAPSVDVVQLRKTVGMVFQQPNPFPKSIFENVAYGPRIHGTRNKSDLADIVEQSLIHAALWDEVKDDLHKSAMALRRPAAEAVHRESPRGKA